MEIASSTASQAMQNAFATNAARGARLAKGVDDPSFEKDMAELPQDEDNVKVQGKVIKTQDEMLGSVIDMLA